jgi:hypothetical protein
VHYRAVPVSKVRAAGREMRDRVPGTLAHGSTLTLEADIDRAGPGISHPAMCRVRDAGEACD